MPKEKEKKPLKRKLDIQHTKSEFTWGSIFATAASIQLEKLDADFLSRTRPNQDEENGLCELAKLSKNIADKTSSSINDTSVACSTENGSNEDTSVSSTMLEGKMVPHPQKEEDLMILVDVATKKIFSAFDRSKDGNLIEIGKMNQDGNVVWIKDAFEDSMNEGMDQGDGALEQFPFPTNPDDHCESPIDSYKDIVSLLEEILPKERCRIYDPYYCDGAMKRNLRTLGFPNVHNEKEDCYQIWSSHDKLPEFDILVTNPPYSDDHIPQLIDFLSSPMMKSKAWFLLMPQWVVKKSYFVDVWDKKAFFLVPKRRYIYYPPKNFRAKKASDVHKKSSPFVTIWFIWGGSMEKTKQLYEYYRDGHTRKTGNCDLVRSKNALRDLRRKGKRKRCG